VTVYYIRLTNTSDMKKTFTASAKPSLVMGCILSWLRLQVGLDQKKMAKYLGITQASWSRIENGHATASFEQVINSCEAMNVDFVYVAQLYKYICLQLKLDSVIVSNDVDLGMTTKTKEIVKKTISAHALSVSNKALKSEN